MQRYHEDEDEDEDETTNMGAPLVFFSEASVVHSRKIHWREPCTIMTLFVFS